MKKLITKSKALSLIVPIAKRMAIKYGSIGIANITFDGNDLVFTLADTSTIDVPLIINGEFVVYSNLVSGLTAVDVQAAIDELKVLLDTANGDITDLQNEKFDIAGGTFAGDIATQNVAPDSDSTRTNGTNLAKWLIGYFDKISDDANGVAYSPLNRYYDITGETVDFDADYIPLATFTGEYILECLTTTGADDFTNAPFTTALGDANNGEFKLYRKVTMKDTDDYRVVDKAIQYDNIKVRYGDYDSGTTTYTWSDWVEILKKDMVINDLVSTDIDLPLSAAMGKYLNENHALIDTVVADTDIIAGTNAYFSCSGSGTELDPYIIMPKVDINLSNRHFILTAETQPLSDTYISLKPNGSQRCEVTINHLTEFVDYHYMVNVYDHNDYPRWRASATGVGATFRNDFWATDYLFVATFDINSDNVYSTNKVE